MSPSLSQVQKKPLSNLVKELLRGCAYSRAKILCSLPLPLLEKLIKPLANLTYSPRLKAGDSAINNQCLKI